MPAKEYLADAPCRADLTSSDAAAVVPFYGSPELPTLWVHGFRSRRWRHLDRSDGWPSIHRPWTYR